MVTSSTCLVHVDSEGEDEAPGLGASYYLELPGPLFVDMYITIKRGVHISTKSGGELDVMRGSQPGASSSPILDNKQNRHANFDKYGWKS